jgi:hypothetical protein
MAAPLSTPSNDTGTPASVEMTIEELSQREDYYSDSSISSSSQSQSQSQSSASFGEEEEQETTVGKAGKEKDCTAPTHLTNMQLQQTYYNTDTTEWEKAPTPPVGPPHGNSFFLKEDGSLNELFYTQVQEEYKKDQDPTSTSAIYLLKTEGIIPDVQIFFFFFFVHVIGTEEKEERDKKDKKEEKDNKHEKHEKDEKDKKRGRGRRRRRRKRRRRRRRCMLILSERI